MTAPLNVLLITSDQQHWNTLGHLNPEVPTPNLDRLAAQGLRLDRAYCPNPTCTPTRASIITGLDPSQHGAYSLGTHLDPARPTVGDDLQAAGYRTALVGKAHFQALRSTPEYPSIEAYPVLQDLEFWRRFHGPFYGFEHIELARNHVDEAHIGQHYALWLESKGCRDWRRYFRKPTGTAEGHRFHWPIPEELHYDAWIAERTCARLDGHAQRREPFFLWASFFDPHPPCIAPAPWDTLVDPASVTLPKRHPGEHEANPPHFRLTQQPAFDQAPYREPGGSGVHGFHSHLHAEDGLRRTIAVYYGMIALLDKYVGILLDRLDALGLADRTLVVFTSDHGHFLGQHGLVAKGPFHYEDMLRVPFLARLPGRIPAGTASDALLTLTDLAPTFLDFAGLPVPRRMTGRSQRAAWEGRVAAVRDRLIVDNRHQPTTVNARTLVTKRYKLTVYFDRDYGELFDLQDDPGEVRNRWSDPSAQDLKRDLLLQFLHAEMAREPLPMPRISGA